MTVAERGRFCAACQKTVIDFSSLSDAEVVRITKAESNGKELCGRYDHSQLGRAMVSYESHYTFGAGLIKKIAASLLLLQTAVSSAQDQRVHKSKTQYSKAIKNDEKSGEGRRIISGVVSDFITKKPLVGMGVKIEGTDIKTVSDDAGRYSIQLPDSFNKNTITIQANYTDLTGDEPEGTIILSEEFEISGIFIEREVIMYRYAMDMLGSIELKSYARLPIVEDDPSRRVMTGAIEISSLQELKPELYHPKVKEELKPYPPSFIKKLFGKNTN